MAHGPHEPLCVTSCSTFELKGLQPCVFQIWLGLRRTTTQKSQFANVYDVHKGLENLFSFPKLHLQIVNSYFFRVLQRPQAAIYAFIFKLQLFLKIMPSKPKLASGLMIKKCHAWQFQVHAIWHFHPWTYTTIYLFNIVAITWRGSCASANVVYFVLLQLHQGEATSYSHNFGAWICGYREVFGVHGNISSTIIECSSW
jgi:hypothetical protein